MLQTVFFRSSLFILAVMFSCKKQEENALPYYNTPDFSPQFLFKEEASKKITHTIASFSLTDQNNHVFTDKMTNHKIQIASFIFTSCGSICPIMIKNLKAVSEKYEKDPDVLLLSFSVTPWIDTPQKLKDFKASNTINDPNWHFLTGKKAEIYKLARQLIFRRRRSWFYD